MITDVADRTDDLKRLCSRYHVQRLDLFGSAATGEHHPEDSDLDFVVEFQPAAFSRLCRRLLWPAGGIGAAFRKTR